MMSSLRLIVVGLAALFVFGDTAWAQDAEQNYVLRGSLLQLGARGENITITYIFAGENVPEKAEGKKLFSGSVDHQLAVIGTAYFYKNGCRKVFEYPVRGRFDDDKLQLLTLEGNAPIVGNKCNILRGKIHTTLVIERYDEKKHGTVTE